MLRGADDNSQNIVGWEKDGRQTLKLHSSSKARVLQMLSLISLRNELSQANNRPRPGNSICSRIFVGKKA